MNDEVVTAVLSSILISYEMEVLYSSGCIYKLLVSIYLLF